MRIDELISSSPHGSSACCWSRTTARIRGRLPTPSTVTSLVRPSSGLVTWSTSAPPFKPTSSGKLRRPPVSPRDGWRATIVPSASISSKALREPRRIDSYMLCSPCNVTIAETTPSKRPSGVRNARESTSAGTPVDRETIGPSITRPVWASSRCRVK